MAKGVSGTFGPTAASSGKQTADQFMYANVTPQGVYTATATHPLGLVPAGSTHLTGEVAQTITDDFDSFWCKEIVIKYVPTCGTNFQGEVAMAIVPEISAEPDPTTVTNLLDVPLSCMGPVWADNLEIRYRPGQTPVRFSDTKRMNTGAATSLADTCNGVLVVGTSGVWDGTTSSAVTIPVGRIEATAHWCLWTPSSPGLQ